MGYFHSSGPNSRNYKKVKCGQQVESKCRMCWQYDEIVDHIVSGCELLANTEYISRHNNATIEHL